MPHNDTFFFFPSHNFFPTCGRMPLPALSLWPGRQPCRPRLVATVTVAIHRPTGRRRDSPISSSLFSHCLPLCEGRGGREGGRIGEWGGREGGKEGRKGGRGAREGGMTVIHFLMAPHYLNNNHVTYSRTPNERPPSPTTIPLIRPHFV